MNITEVDIHELNVDDNENEIHLVTSDDELSLDESINYYCFDEEDIHDNKPPHYIIKPLTYERARQHNLILYVSGNPSKKIDVYDKNGGKYLCSIGDIRYLDYPYLIDKYGRTYADIRRELHNLRYEKKQIRNYSSVYYEKLLLW
jgi:hypothetical protein